MTVTLDDFCHKLLDDELFRERLEPERLAAAFADYFRLSGRPTVAGLTALLQDACFGTVSSRELDGLKGVHFGAPRGEYDIYYRDDLWEGAKVHTVLHEAYEIIHETLCALHSDDPPERSVCREADRFAAAVLMPPDTFTAYAQASGAGRGGPPGGVPVCLRFGGDASGRGDAPATPGCAAVRTTG